MFSNFIILCVVASVVNASVIINVYDGKSLVHLLHDSTKSTSVSSCNLQTCEQLCRKYGYSGGACIGDDCKCFNTEPIAIDDNSLAQVPQGATQAHAAKSCNLQPCEELCRRLGFPGGAYVGDKCDCDNFKEDSEVPTYMTDEDDDAVDADSKNPINLKDVILTADQVKKLKYCDPIACNIMCTTLNYVGGECSGGASGNCMCF